MPDVKSRFIWKVPTRDSEGELQEKEKWDSFETKRDAELTAQARMEPFSVIVKALRTETTEVATDDGGEDS